MFGYINPDAPYLFKKDEVLYRALYCGACKGIGKSCGQRARTALTYDVAFLSALVHNIRGEDVKIEKRRCAVHWIRRRPVALPDETTLALGCVNTILAYFKLCDDKRDGEKRAILRHLYKKGYKRALKRRPAVAEIIKRRTEELATLEEEGCASLDMAAEPTAMMMAEIAADLLGGFSNDGTQKLFYSIGKWIYLIDALDDYDKDVKKGRYNVIYNIYRKSTLKEAVEVGGEDLKFAFDALFCDMREGLSGIKFAFNHDLTDNIILRGIPLKTRSVFYGAGQDRKGKKNEQKKS